mmetsp:Transcript_37466/g.70324  ORF Transcript_37466/g.70324 Transcript_37466/m.70324 type:complete len:345 (-) Transcript_37466:368-1402(-)|eukprot:CAMPEP_0114258198 /NCGR_PEP_ID=MMETSP0058-20121206/19188_1 /TAXON_ID=36894 /ORGANISM="Pyramimonas parkeae, CCMP726" /LENGTH=344 /DNA_ID=CAMNT_0001373075 /DNA_START=367 /DNA_END=1401 /DNA_ORIENTATION=-
MTSWEIDDLSVTRTERALQSLLSTQLSTQAKPVGVHFVAAASRDTQEHHSGLQHLDGESPRFCTNAREKFQRLCPAKSTDLSSGTNASIPRQSVGRRAKELEEAMLRTKPALRSISHLALGDSFEQEPHNSRVSLQGVGYADACTKGPRTVEDVFKETAPEIQVFDLESEMTLALAEQSRSKRCEAQGAQVCTSSSINIEGTTSGSISQAQALKNLSDLDIISSKPSGKDLELLPGGGRFKNHDPGRPSTVLLLRNLHSNVVQDDLMALFWRFQHSHSLTAKLLQTGRMRGQAFVTFPTVREASAARELIHGFVLHGRPVLAYFGKCQQNDEVCIPIVSKPKDS